MDVLGAESLAINDVHMHNIETGNEVSGSRTQSLYSLEVTVNQASRDSVQLKSNILPTDNSNDTTIFTL